MAKGLRDIFLQKLVLVFSPENSGAILSKEAAWLGLKMGLGP